MSADNFVAVYPSTVPNNRIWYISDGAMSILGEDCQYRGREVGRCASREFALVEAHDYAKTLQVLEYGVIELDEIPLQHCGRCFVCVYERHLIDDSLPRCAKCEKPIADGEWQCWIGDKIFHNACQPR